MTEELITEAQIDALEELAKGATPGPWEAGDVWVFTGPVYPDDNRLSNVLGMKYADEDRADAERARGLANAAFIAAADPDMVLALLAERRRLADALEAVTAERDERELALSAVPGYTRPQYFKQEFERVLRDLVNAEAERDRLKAEIETALKALDFGNDSIALVARADRADAILNRALNEGKNDDQG